MGVAARNKKGESPLNARELDSEVRRLASAHPEYVHFGDTPATEVRDAIRFLADVPGRGRRPRFALSEWPRVRARAEAELRALDIDPTVPEIAFRLGIDPKTVTTNDRRLRDLAR